MADTRLLIDQGNTRLKWVLARDGRIDKQSAGQGAFEDFTATFRNGADNPGSVLVSSVAGEEKSQMLAEFCRERWGIEAKLQVSTARRGGVINAYHEPERLGVDRWLAIVGAVRRYGKPVVIWDLGTASTLDAVDIAGRHLGGMIYPGPATMLNSLDRDTRLVVPGDLQNAGTEPGSATLACIRNGVFAAQQGALNQFLRQVSKNTSQPPRLVITGGAARWILPSLEFDHVHDPWLVFRGMLVD